MNRRKEIRNRITSEVRQALPNAKVFEHRQQALTKLELPAVVVWVDSEHASRVSCDLVYNLKAEVRVEVLRLGGGINWVDSASKRLENCLLRGENRFLGGVASRFDLLRTELQMFEQGELEMCGCILSFEAEYISEPAEDEAPEGEIGEVVLT